MICFIRYHEYLPWPVKHKQLQINLHTFWYEMPVRHLNKEPQKLRPQNTNKRISCGRSLAVLHVNAVVAFHKAKTTQVITVLNLNFCQCTYVSENNIIITSYNMSNFILVLECIVSITFQSNIAFVKSRKRLWKKYGRPRK